MSYIRTKDSVYELKENMTIENGVYSFFGKIYDTTEKHLFRNDKDLGEFVSQSENLEELCDEFVMTHYFKETNYTKCEVLKEDKDLMIKAVRLKKQHNKDKELKNEFNIYGAIWTSKGLIYVAKINEDGKLVLI